MYHWHKEGQSQWEASIEKSAVIAMRYLSQTFEIKSARNIVQNLNAARQARLKVSKNGFSNPRTGITFEDRRMCYGFRSGEKRIPATGAKNPKTGRMRYKIS